MSERLEKLYTLTDIDNLPDSPVTIEAGGLIKDNKTGRVIARMYLKNCSDRPLSSVLVGFRPRGENDKTISGMRDYLYDAAGVAVGEIFGDQTGILFDNNETKAFSANVEGVDFEDGDFWDAEEAKREAEKLKLIVPEEKEQTGEAPEMWEKPAEPIKSPEVWTSEEKSEEPHSAEIYGAAVVEQKFDEPAEEYVPASLLTRQLMHEERPALEEETYAYKKDQEEAVIELDGPSDEEQPVIELDEPVESQEETSVQSSEEPSDELDAETEPVQQEEAPAEAEETAEAGEPEETAEPETEAVETEEVSEPEAEVPEVEAAAEVPEQAQEEAVEEPEPEEEIPSGPVRLADIYNSGKEDYSLSYYADSYGLSRAETPVQPEELPEEVPEEVVAEPEEAPEAEAQADEQEAPAAVEHQSLYENPWAGYSADYAQHTETTPEEAEPTQAETVSKEEPAVIDVPKESAEAPEAVKTQEAVPEAPAAVPEVTETVEAQEVVPEAPEVIDVPEETKEEAAEPEEAEIPEKPAARQNADVVFADEPETIPSIIDGGSEKVLTGEDHSARNLLNIIVFGGIALVILLVLLIKM